MQGKFCHSTGMRRPMCTSAYHGYMYTVCYRDAAVNRLSRQRRLRWSGRVSVLHATPRMFRQAIQQISRSTPCSRPHSMCRQQPDWTQDIHQTKAMPCILLGLESTSGANAACMQLRLHALLISHRCVSFYVRRLSCDIALQPILLSTEWLA